MNKCVVACAVLCVMCDVFIPNVMKLLLKFISLFYYMAISIRHWMFDCGILKSQKFDIPIICVGNITVGGTGKTPVAEMLVAAMSKDYKVALLSRGYGRRTSGYLEVKANSSYRDVGDEPLQIKQKFPGVLVVVCERRVEAINKILKSHPEVNLIIMDDGFQHRYVDARINVVVVDSTRHFDSDSYLPAGTLRDKISALRRGHYFIVTKCQEAMSELDQRLWRKDLQKFAFQKVYFSRVAHVTPVSPFESELELNEGDKVVAMSGIGNPKAFVDGLKQHYKVVKSFNFSDHHRYTLNDLQMVAEYLEKHPTLKLISTEKDVVKFRRSRRVPETIRQKLFYIPMRLEFLEGSDPDFVKTIREDLAGKMDFDDLPALK